MFQYFCILSLICSSSLANSGNLNLFETEQRFHPEYGKNGAVATQESHATKVGLDILKNGGNAIDAAVAIGYSLAVTLPRAGNLGGGGFMTIWLNKEKKAYVINYRETAPDSIDITAIQKMSDTEFNTSYKSAGVPGTVAGLNLALEKFGSMTLPDVIMPAIELAKNGFKVTAAHLESLAHAKEKLLKDPEAKKIFYKKSNQEQENYDLYDLGEIIKQPELAETLIRISEQGNDGFYKGKTALLLTNAMAKNNGYIKADDLANYQARIVEPIITNFRNFTILLPPPPSSGGITVSQILKLAEKIDLSNTTPNTAQYFHNLTEIFNQTYLDRNYKLGDPLFVNINPKELLSEEYITALSAKINKKAHVPSKDIDPHAMEWKEGTNTTHFVVIDKDLNVVSNTYTINYSFGTGKVIPGLGFFINNELDDFTLSPGKSNGYELIQGKNNLIAAKKQPLSSMTPTIVLDSQKNPYMATGTPGGSRIITTVSQILLNTLVYGYNISTAVSLPRIHSQLWPDELYYEQGISQDTIVLLNNMGHKTKATNSIGSAQSLLVKPPYLLAVADPRRAGAQALTH